MKHLITREDYFLLLESSQEGKQVLMGLVDQELKKLNLESADPKKKEVAERRLQDKYFGPGSDFEAIKALLHKNEWQKYIGAFTRFRFLQGGELGTAERPGELRNIFSQIVRLKDHIGELPLTLDQYSKIQGGPGDKKGWDQLGDDLNSIDELLKGDWLVKLLPKNALSNERARERGLSPVNLREKYKASSKELKNRLRELAARLAPHPNLKTMVSGKLSGTSSIEDLVADLEKIIRTLGSQDKIKLIDIAMEAGDSVRLVYNGENHMVFSFRNDSQLPHLCRNAVKWCIQPSWYNSGYADQFFNYAGGSVQLGILDFTVDSLNPYHTVGVTIKPTGSISTLCNQPDHCTGSSPDYRKTLLKFECANDGTHNYPQELIDAIEDVFSQEVEIKKITDPIYKVMKSSSTGAKDEKDALVKSLTGLMRDMQSVLKSTGSDEDPDFEKKIKIARQIIFNEIKGANNLEKLKGVKQEILEIYSSGKRILSSAFDVETFLLMFKDSGLLTPDVISKIIKAIQDTVKKVEPIAAKFLNSPSSGLGKRILGFVEGGREAIDQLSAVK
jgi:hypothetical protein